VGAEPVAEDLAPDAVLREGQPGAPVARADGARLDDLRLPRLLGRVAARCALRLRGALERALERRADVRVEPQLDGLDLDPQDRLVVERDQDLEVR
jgi:hypothetical protein